MDKQIQQLADLFLKFPGIGHRQAARFAYFILTQPESYVSTLARSLLEARSHAHTCTRCLRIFEGAPGMCAVCSDTTRDQSILMVVEKSHDIDTFDKTEYRGVFFVLGSLIPIVQKDIVAGTNLLQLKARVTAEADTLTEVILAFPLTPNGEHTDAVIREVLEKISKVPLSSLGRGLSTGTEIEYADLASLNASLKKRE